MPGGRPTNFKPEYCTEAAKLCAMFGATDSDLAQWFGVTERTIGNWKHDYPEFFLSIKPAKETFDERIERSLAERAMGYRATDTKFATFEGEITDSQEYIKTYPPDPTACIFWLTNRQPKKWKRMPGMFDDENDTVIPVKVIVQRVDASGPPDHNQPGE